MSFKRKYLEEKYKYLLLKKQYKYLLGGASKTDDLFENQRLCYVDSTAIDNARKEPILILTEDDKILAKTRPGETMWELTDPSTWPTSAKDPDKITFLKSLKYSNLKLYTSMITVRCEFDKNINLNDSSIIAAFGKPLYLRNDTSQEWGKCPSAKGRGVALFGIGMQDLDNWLGINSTDPKKLEWIEGTNVGEMRWRWRQFIIQVNDTDNTQFRFMLFDDIDISLGIHVSDTAELTLSETPTVFTTDELQKFKLFGKKTPSVHSTVFKTVNNNFIENINIEVGFTESQFAQNLYLRNDTNQEWGNCPSAKGRGIALFGIGIQDRDNWLGINSTDPKKLEWIEGTNVGEMRWRWRQFIIQVNDTDNTQFRFMLFDDNISLGIHESDTRELTLSENPTVFTIVGLHHDFQKYTKGTSTSTPPIPPTENHDVSQIKVWGSRKPTPVPDSLDLQHDDTAIGNQIRQVDLATLGRITGDPATNPAFDFGGHQHHDLQVLIIYGFTGASVFFQKVLGDLESYYEADKDALNLPDIGGLAQLPFRQGSGTHSHTFCPFINMYCNLILDDSVVDKVTLSNQAYQTFSYIMTDKSGNDIQWNPYVGKQDRLNRLTAYYQILHNMVDIYTGISFADWVHLILTFLPIADHALRFKPNNYMIYNDQKTYYDNNNPMLGKRILVYMFALACNESRTLRDINLAKTLSQDDIDYVLANIPDLASTLKLIMTDGKPIHQFTRGFFDPRIGLHEVQIEANNFIMHTYENSSESARPAGWLARADSSESVFDDPNNIILPFLNPENVFPGLIARKQTVRTGELVRLEPDIQNILTSRRYGWSSRAIKGSKIVLTCYTTPPPQNLKLLISGTTYIFAKDSYRNTGTGLTPQDLVKPTGETKIDIVTHASGLNYEDGPEGIFIKCELTSLTFNDIKGIWNKDGPDVEISIGVLINEGNVDDGINNNFSRKYPALTWRSDKEGIFTSVNEAVTDRILVYNAFTGILDRSE